MVVIADERERDGEKEREREREREREMGRKKPFEVRLSLAP